MGCTGSRGLGEFEREALQNHNQYRKKHNAAPLTWSSECQRAARNWANHMAKTGRFEHGNHSGMGQNLGMVYGQEATGEKVTTMWYNELKDYSFNNPSFQSNTGHFTQVVWKGTKEFGIAKAVAKDGKVYMVGNYKPPGNVMNQFGENVERAK
eukprot:m.23478 g.23478  ORF g.23478 m.23478 type:complete len:153 (+) comp28484_c0_seq2:113-571(+)